MFKRGLEFIIKSKKGNTIAEILAVVDAIRKKHPNAKICVEVEM